MFSNRIHLPNWIPSLSPRRSNEDPAASNGTFRIFQANILSNPQKDRQVKSNPQKVVSYKPIFEASIESNSLDLWDIEQKNPADRRC
jgi:hypothetical protein